MIRWYKYLFVIIYLNSNIKNDIDHHSGEKFRSTQL